MHAKNSEKGKFAPSFSLPWLKRLSALGGLDLTRGSDRIPIIGLRYRSRHDPASSFWNPGYGLRVIQLLHYSVIRPTRQAIISRLTNSSATSVHQSIGVEELKIGERQKNLTFMPTLKGCQTCLHKLANVLKIGTKEPHVWRKLNVLLGYFILHHPVEMSFHYC